MNHFTKLSRTKYEKNAKLFARVFFPKGTFHPFLRSEINKIQKYITHCMPPIAYQLLVCFPL